MKILRAQTSGAKARIILQMQRTIKTHALPGLISAGKSANLFCKNEAARVEPCRLRINNCLGFVG